MQVAAACDGRSDRPTSGVAKCAILARYGNATKIKAIKPVIPASERFDDTYVSNHVDRDETIESS